MKTPAIPLYVRPNLWACFSAISFFFICTYSDKMALPLFLIVVLGGMNSGLPYILISIIVLFSWLYLLIFAVIPQIQTYRPLHGSVFVLWVLLLYALPQNLGRQDVWENYFFWIPALIFSISSGKLLRWLFVTSRL